MKSTMKLLPAEFLERLKDILPPENFDSVASCFSCRPVISVRINTLKISIKKAVDVLKKSGITFRQVPWFKTALVLEGVTPEAFGQMNLVQEGMLYRQGLSSMLPVVVLSPQPEEKVLDMCAAPGSKTTQMAAMMQNQGQIEAVEVVRNRFYKLKSVLSLMGAENVVPRLMDARRYRAREGLFDKILVDAPCSSEGRFDPNNPKTYRYWSLRKIKEMAHKQKGLLLNATRLLAPGGVLVYSTCTFSPEENEGVVSWLLRKAQGALEVEKVEVDGIASYPAKCCWQKKEFNPRVEKCLRVLPDDLMEGFFVAKIVKHG